MELDDLKGAWAELDRRIEGIESMLHADYRSRRFDKMRRTLRLVGAGQVVQLLVWLVVVALVAPFWIEHRHVPHLLAAGLLLHAYGILAIGTAVIQLVVTTRLYYTAPIVECQKRLAGLERLRITCAVVTLLPWWVLWIAVLMVGVKALLGVDVYVQAPAWILANVAFGVLGMAVTTWVARRLTRRPSTPRWVQGIIDDFAGRSLRRAKEQLADVERFAKEA
jgi:hypothetical protein